MGYSNKSHNNGDCQINNNSTVYCSPSASDCRGQTQLHWSFCKHIIGWYTAQMSTILDIFWWGEQQKLFSKLIHDDFGHRCEDHSPEIKEWCKIQSFITSLSCCLLSITAVFLLHTVQMQLCMHMPLCHTHTLNSDSRLPLLSNIPPLMPQLCLKWDWTLQISPYYALNVCEK